PVPQRGGRPPEGDGMSDGQLMTAVQTLERTPCAPPFAILDSRLTRHGEQRGTVPRRALLQRLEASRGTPVVTVVAPPGYGKTTVLAQWAERRGPRVAWVSCDRTDNDPVALWTAVAPSARSGEKSRPRSMRLRRSARPRPGCWRRDAGASRSSRRSWLRSSPSV